MIPRIMAKIKKKPINSGLVLKLYASILGSGLIPAQTCIYCNNIEKLVTCMFCAQYIPLSAGL